MKTLLAVLIGAVLSGCGGLDSLDEFTAPDGGLTAAASDAGIPTVPGIAAEPAWDDHQSGGQVQAAWRWCYKADGGVVPVLFHQPCPR